MARSGQLRGRVSDDQLLNLLEQVAQAEGQNSGAANKSKITVSVPTIPERCDLPIDRKENLYAQYGLAFPHQDGPDSMHSNVVLDGELVIDTDPKTGRRTLCLLTFDCLVVGEENLMHKPLSSRYGRLKEWIVKPHHKLLAMYPDMVKHAPFQVKLKPMELAYGIQAVFKEHLPKLQHGNDGLIFTGAEAPYTSGTDPRIIKWKPPSENSIDFKLELRFPPSSTDPREADLRVKPLFLLMENCGTKRGHEFFDCMHVEDDEWEEWKASGEQIDDRIIEVVWDANHQNWRKLRFRTDKTDGNFTTVVQSVITSIKDGVEAPVLVEKAGQIRYYWKQREAARKKAAAARPPSNGVQMRPR
ncbi:Dcp1p-Dcp2p decapping enzyme complex alpha subunit [Cystobasidiomycetes sp. EMM_F5]